MTQSMSQSTETYTPDALVAGETHLATRSYTLLSGQNLKRGTVVGQITASGKITISTTAASDGSAVPFGILADDYDATAGDVGGAAVYLKAEVNGNSLILGTGWTLASIFVPLRDAGIFVKGVVSQSGVYS